MGYALYCEDGYRGPIASTKGWEDAVAALNGCRNPNVQHLLETGYTDMPQDAAQVIRTWAAKHSLPHDVEETLTNFSSLLGGCKLVGIVSDGVGSDTQDLLLDELANDQVLYVARHGKTNDDDEGIASGWREADLNKEGQGEAEALARQLTDRGIGEIYSSDLNRTMDTAHIIGSRIGAKVIPLRGLRSWHHGGEGLPQKEAQRIIDRGIAHPDKKPVPDSESRNEMADRFTDTLHKIIDRQKVIKKPILIVTHSWNAGLIPLILSGADQHKVKPLDPGTAEKLVYDGDNWDVEHLQDELPSPYLINGPAMPLAKPHAIDSPEPGAIQQVFDKPEEHFRPSPMPSGDKSDRALVQKMSEKLPDHCDFIGCVESMDAAVLKLQKLLTGLVKSKIIKAVVQQAVAQIRRGVSSTGLQFSSPMGIEHKLRPEIEAIKTEAEKNARQEIVRMTKGKVQP